MEWRWDGDTPALRTFILAWGTVGGTPLPCTGAQPCAPTEGEGICLNCDLCDFWIALIPHTPTTLTWMDRMHGLGQG